MRHLVCFVVVAVVTLFYVVDAQAAVFRPVTATLANGLQIIIVPNRLSPVVLQMVWYKTGATDEQSGKTGLAHYLEHLMFRGSVHMPSGEYSATVAGWGGKENAFTSYDYTAYFITASSEHLAHMMALEAERMQNLTINPELAAPELQVVLNERQERTDNNPEGRFYEKLRATLFPEHPYGRPVIGWLRDIEGLTTADATAFYHRYYAPNNAVVVIVGDVQPDAVLAKAAAIYGAVPRRDVPQRQGLPPAPPPQQEKYTMVDKGIEQPQVLWQAVVPSRNSGARTDSYALEVLSDYLDGQAGALYRALVVEQGIASGLEVSYDPYTRGDGMFSIGIAPKPDGDVDAVQPALLVALRDIEKKGFSESDIALVKRRLVREAAFARDSLMMPAYIFGMGLTTGQRVQDIEAWPQRIGAVTVAEVKAALRQVLDNPKTVTGVLLPDPAATEAERNAAREKSGQGKDIR